MDSKRIYFLQRCNLTSVFLIKGTQVRRHSIPWLEVQNKRETICREKC